MQLARLEAQRQRRAERSLALSEKEEFVDEEYRLLLERYGHRVKVPNVPHDPWKQDLSVTIDSARSRSGESSPGKPHIPRVKSSCGAASKGAVAAAGSTAGASSASPSAAAAGTARTHKVSTGERNQASQVVAGIMAARRSSRAEGIALPPVTSPTGPGSPRRRASAQNDVPKVVKQITPACAAEPLSGDSVMSEVPEPERSVMPRKDTLRKFQQEILKKTDVSFYKNHMKKQLRRILEATELTYSDTSARREQASWNLAKPLTVGELKLLSSVVARTATVVTRAGESRPVRTM